MASSATQLKQLTADLAARDREVAALREEVESTRRRLHALQVRNKMWWWWWWPGAPMDSPA